MNAARIMWIGASLCFFTGTSRLLAQSETDKTRFNEIVLPFSEAKPFNYYYIPEQSAVVLELLNVKAAGLAPIDQYDETLIRKIVIREIPGKGSEIKFFLRDNQVRVAITEHTEPPRLHLDFYDVNYRESVDPSTGLPRSTPLWPETKRDFGEPDSLPPLQIPPRGGKAIKGTDGKKPDSGLRFVAPISSKGNEGEPEKMAAEASLAPAGRGDQWTKLPFYFYRFPIVTERADELKKTSKITTAAVNDVEAMANYAAQLFDLGHEKRALAAYQSVMQKALGILEQDPMHLWRLGEIHFGMGNNTLAEGYFQALRDKHPDSPFAALAQLRQLDLKFAKLLDKQGSKEVGPLLRDLDKISVGTDAELAAQILIRKAFWSGAAAAKSKSMALGKTLPPLDGDIRTTAVELMPKVSAQRTAYVLSSLVLNDMLQPAEPWTSATAKEFNGYFSKYTGEGLEPYYKSLSEKGQKKIFAQIEAAYKANEFERAVSIYQSIPPRWRDQSGSASMDMILAESFRKSERLEDASRAYKKAAEGATDPEKKFFATYWNHSVGLKQKSKASDKSLTKSGADLLKLWRDQPPASRDKYYAAVKADIESALLEDKADSAMAEIHIDSLQKPLNSETPASSDDNSQAATQVKLLAKSLRLLDGAGKKLPAKRARELLLGMKPEVVKKDAEAKAAWSEAVGKAADQFRKADQFYDAGKAYVALGEVNDDKGRAESLYKGGLLLFRAGRRDEAVAAFKKASEDRNDRIYADMATKRLQQLQ